MEFQITEAVELIKTLAETENLTLRDALQVFVIESGLDVEYASQLKGALFEAYTLDNMASDSLTKVLYSVFVSGESAEDIHEVDTKETQEGTKYKVRVKDRQSGSSYVRYATREKIAELRANPNISSVELTDHGTTGEDDKGERTAAAKGGGGVDRDGDGKKESSSKEHAGVVHNAIQRKMGGKPDGQDTRKEGYERNIPQSSAMARGGETAAIAKKASAQRTAANAAGARGPEFAGAAKMKQLKATMPQTMRNSYEPEEDLVDEAIDPKGAARMDAAKGKKKETEDETNKRLMLGKYSPAARYGKKKEKEVEEGIDFKGAAREQARRDKIQDEKDKKSPSSKDRRLALRKFRPGASKEERAEGGRDAMREKGTSPKKDGKKMFEQYLELRENRRAARAAGGYKDDSKKQTDPSKEGFTGISNNIEDIMKQSAAMDKEKAKKKVASEAFEVTDADEKNNTEAYKRYKAGNKAYTRKKAEAKVAEGWKPDPAEKRRAKSAKLGREESIEQGKSEKYGRDDEKIKDLYKRRMAVDFKKKKSSIGEDFVSEADLVDAGRKSEGQRNKKKLSGEGVDNSTNVKLMPKLGESVVTDTKLSAPEARVASITREPSLSYGIVAELAERMGLVSEECCPDCGTPECSCDSDTKLLKEKGKKKREPKAKLDEAGMPILEYSENNARPGPSPEMINPGKDPEGDVGHMNPKGKPKRYKNKGEAPGDRRPNDPSGPDLPNEKGTVPNGAGV